MITIVGLGVLGTRVLSLLSEYDKVMVVDYDNVEDKNIRRQYPPAATGMRKVDAARKFIREDIDVIHKHIDWSTVGVLHDSELVLDCTDNMLARYVINDYCTKQGIPWIHGALSDTHGTVAAFIPNGPCYQCVYPSGTGEECTEELDTSIANRVAEIMAQEINRLRMNPRPRFIRVASESSGALGIKKRAGCPSCNGKYNYLKPKEYYITYCNTAKCMSAKPVKTKKHDLGTGQELEVEGMPLTVFENGEIHFHNHANDDDLDLIAKSVYKIINKEK